MGSLRTRIFAPDPRDVTFERRGFHAPGPVQQANLGKVGGIFLTGFGYGLIGRGMTDIESSLEEVEKPFRGFAYEGCAMALAVRDALLPAGRHWVNDFLAGPGKPHVYMAHIGVGWAMARLPSVRGRAILPQDEVLRWLSLEGYGFHQAYFKTVQYVNQQHQAQVPLFKPAAYTGRAIDQGIGRALWFVNGSDVRDVADLHIRAMTHPAATGERFLALFLFLLDHLFRRAGDELGIAELGVNAGDVGVGKLAGGQAVKMIFLAFFVVGEAARMGEVLNWFERRNNAVCAPVLS